MNGRSVGVWFAAALLIGAAPAPMPAKWHDTARDMLAHAIEIPTVLGRGKGKEIADYFADQYRKGGFADADIKVMPYEDTAALIVRWPAAGKAKARPILLMGHMDVVEAKREDSTNDPFKFLEKDGYYYGRGTIDMKSGLVGITTALLKLKAEGFKPSRDIIVFFTGDEETNGVGARMGATEWRKWTDAEFGLNADGGGGGFTSDGKPLGFTLQTAEKTNATYLFTARNKGGHSSRPRPDNAIYDLVAALKRLEDYRFTPSLNETTRAYFTVRQQSEKGPLGDAMRAWLKDEKDGKAADFIEASPTEVALTRTRCVATRLFGGHADNALPQLATATVNCRILPGVDPNAIRDELQTIAGNAVAVTRLDKNVASLASPIRPDVLAAYTEAVHRLHPGSPIVPQMSTGASDARPFRVAGLPVYGTGGVWAVIPEDERAHGKDERVPVKAIDDNVEHWHYLVSKLAGGK